MIILYDLKRKQCFKYKLIFLEAQLLFIYIDVTNSLLHNVTHRTFNYFWAISSLFVDRFGRSLRFCYLEFDWKAIYDMTVEKLKS